MIVYGFQIYDKIIEQLKKEHITLDESLKSKLVCFDFDSEYHFRFNDDDELVKLTKDEIDNLRNENIYYVYINDPEDKPMNKREYKNLLEKLDNIEVQLLNISSMLLNIENIKSKQDINEIKEIKDFQNYINENIPHLNSIFSGKKMKDILVILNDITDSAFTEKDNVNHSLSIIKEKLNLMLQQDLLLDKLKNLNLI